MDRAAKKRDGLYCVYSGWVVGQFIGRQVLSTLGIIRIFDNLIWKF